MADNFDKFRPDWTVGTLTLTGGSTAFTATNAELILAAIREGDAIITPSGFFLPIETLAEDGLTGTLSNPAPATAAGTFDTRIRYQSDNSRFTGALLALTRQLTGGNLQSFGNLQGLQDLLPIFVGPGALGLINKSELGLQDPNGTLAKFATLVLAANKFLSTNGDNNLVQSDITAAAIALLNLSGSAAADRLPYLNGANGAALTPLTSVARNLLDDTTTAAQRGTLGIGRPAFKAHLAANQLVYNGTTNLSFTASALNVGNCWSGGSFTAPEAGMYFFYLGLTPVDGTANTGNLGGRIIRNGSTYAETFMSKASGYYSSFSVASVISLAAGDTVTFALILDGMTGQPLMQSFRNYATGVLVG